MKHMKPLSHMLMAAVLLMTAFPCFHATAHGLQEHDPAEAASICISHTHCCHSCSETACPEEFEMPQQGFSAVTSFVAPQLSLVLFVAPETTTDLRITAAETSRVAESIRTVQLLI